MKNDNIADIRSIGGIYGLAAAMKWNSGEKALAIAMTEQIGNPALVSIHLEKAEAEEFNRVFSRFIELKSQRNRGFLKRIITKLRGLFK